jgi:hypothetical protein
LSTFVGSAAGVIIGPVALPVVLEFQSHTPIPIRLDAVFTGGDPVFPDPLKPL